MARKKSAPAVEQMCQPDTFDGIALPDATAPLEQIEQAAGRLSLRTVAMRWQIGYLVNLAERFFQDEQGSESRPYGDWKTWQTTHFPDYGYGTIRRCARVAAKLTREEVAVIATVTELHERAGIPTGSRRRKKGEEKKGPGIVGGPEGAGNGEAGGGGAEGAGNGKAGAGEAGAGKGAGTGEAGGKEVRCRMPQPAYTEEDAQKHLERYARLTIGGLLTLRKIVNRLVQQGRAADAPPPDVA